MKCKEKFKNELVSLLLFYFFSDLLSKLGLIEEEQNDVPIGKTNVF